MQQDIDTTDVEYERYKDWDFSSAKPTTNPTILKLQARKKAYDRLMSLLDDDVQALIVSHDNPQDKARVNAVVRAMFATG